MDLTPSLDLLRATDLLNNPGNNVLQTERWIERNVCDVGSQDIRDLPSEIGESRENNGREPAEAAGHHRPDVQRVPEHKDSGRAARRYRRADRRRSQSVPLPN